MAHIYLAFVDTPGFFASLIRLYIKQRYIHVVISMDAGLEEAYSVGRRNPFIPLSGLSHGTLYSLRIDMQCGTKGTAAQKIAKGFSQAVSISLYYFWATLSPDGQTLLSEKSLYLLFLYCQAAKGESDCDFR